MGIQFLKHIERNAVLLFLIPVDSEDVAADYSTLLGELQAFDDRMLTKPRLVGFSKLDLLPPEERAKWEKKARKAIPADIPTMAFSSVAHLKLDDMKRALFNQVKISKSFGEAE